MNNVRMTVLPLDGNSFPRTAYFHNTSGDIIYKFHKKTSNSPWQGPAGNVGLLDEVIRWVEMRT